MALSERVVGDSARSAAALAGENTSLGAWSPKIPIMVCTSARPVHASG